MFHESEWLAKCSENEFLVCNKMANVHKRHDAIKRFCAQCLPYKGVTRNILLFAALKLHIHGPLGKFIKLFLESRDFMVASHSAKCQLNLSKYLLEGVRFDQGTHTNPHIFEHLVHNQSKQLALAKDLACAVIWDCRSNNESQNAWFMCANTLGDGFGHWDSEQWFWMQHQFHD